jgi:hypothetical protein
MAHFMLFYMPRFAFRQLRHTALQPSSFVEPSRTLLSERCLSVRTSSMVGYHRRLLLPRERSEVMGWDPWLMDNVESPIPRAKFSYLRSGNASASPGQHHKIPDIHTYWVVLHIRLNAFNAAYQTVPGAMRQRGNSDPSRRIGTAPLDMIPIHKVGIAHTVDRD